MGFVPESAIEVTARLMARTVARGPLTDIAPGDPVLAVHQTMGEEFAGIQTAIQNRMDVTLLGKSGPDLDDGVRLLTNGAVTRSGPQSATGPCLRITRQGSSGALVVPAGTLYSRSDNPTLIYVQSGSVTIPDGSTFYGEPGSYVPVTSATPGSIGNAPNAGTINIVGSGAPATLVLVEQMEPLLGGIDREPDPSFRARAQNYMTANADRTCDEALLYVAKTFRSSTGVRARHASIYRTPEVPCVTVLTVDNGSAFAGETRPGATVSQIILNGNRQVIIESPVASDTLGVSQVKINGVPATSPSWNLRPEQGLLTLSASLVSSGDTVQVSSYDVYTGFVAELQAVLFGRGTDPLASSPWIASGAYVQVAPPVPEPITISLLIQPRPGASLEALAAQCEAVLREYIASLGPGGIFLVMDAYTALRTNVPDLENATFYPETTTGETAVSTDFPPINARYSLTLGLFEART